MKRSAKSVVYKMIFTIAILMPFAGESVTAQIDGITTTTRPVLNSGKKVKSALPKTIVKREVRYLIETNTVKIRPTGINVYTLPFANITLEFVGQKKVPVKKLKADDKGVAADYQLTAGTYKLSAALDGFEPDTDEITIINQKIAAVPLILEKKKYDFSIQTNVEKGEVRFAPVRVLDQNSDGKLKVEEIEGYCVVPIENQKAVIKDLTAGFYNIDVSAPDAPEFEKALRVVEINDETKDNLFEVILEDKQSKTTFSQYSIPEAWELPVNWKIEPKGIKAVGEGVNLPKSKDFRFYKNFEMRALVKVLNNSSVGFAVRAQDEKNYYLIQLTGEDAKTPYKISGFVVKNGKISEPVIAENTRHILKKDITDEKYFSVFIKATGNIFEVYAETSSGKIEPLGKAIFKDDNFPIGAVGLSGAEKSSFEVGFFTVCNEVCK